MNLILTVKKDLETIELNGLGIFLVPSGLHRASEFRNPAMQIINIIQLLEINKVDIDIGELDDMLLAETWIVSKSTMEDAFITGNLAEIGGSFLLDTKEMPVICAFSVPKMIPVVLLRDLVEDMTGYLNLYGTIAIDDDHGKRIQDPRNVILKCKLLPMQTASRFASYGCFQDFLEEMIRKTYTS